MFSVQHQNLRLSPHDGNRARRSGVPAGKIFPPGLAFSAGSRFASCAESTSPLCRKMRYKGEPERRAENRQYSVLKMTKK